MIKRALIFLILILESYNAILSNRILKNIKYILKKAKFLNLNFITIRFIF